ncbi:unnamed protein product [Polarella glacialis]|uniref:Uncharacterized protein n=1 Tax=Polarella glacialis TaxID=89957 RepID=A0A813L092_POLGL|nr:unnamed protein product [Polarella glacialis]
MASHRRTATWRGCRVGASAAAGLAVALSATGLVSFVSLAGSFLPRGRSFGEADSESLGQLWRHRSLLRCPRSSVVAKAYLADKGTFLVYEEMKKPPKEKLVRKRRGRTFNRLSPEDPWEEVEEEVEIGLPSEDPDKLAMQFFGLKKVSHMLAFLESAVHSPAFKERHAVKALESLVTWRLAGGFSEDELARFGREPGVLALADRLQELLAQRESLRSQREVDADKEGEEKEEEEEKEDEEEDEDEGLGAHGSVSALRSIAVFKEEAPKLSRLVPALASEAKRVAKTMCNKQVAICVWAISELKSLTRQLQDELLPLLVQNGRIHGVRQYCKDYAHAEYALLKRGILALRRDVPYLCKFLPVQ